MVSRALLPALLVGALLLAGCASQKGGQDVSNNPDAFRYSANWETKSGTDTYTWSNSKTTAMMNVAVAPGQGSLLVKVTDAAGKPVWDSGVLAKPSSARTATASGAAGNWRIDIVYEGFAGNVTVQAHAGSASA